MPRSASPYLSWLSNVLNRKLAAILRGEPDKSRALKKAAEVFQLHFTLIAAYGQRKFPLKKKLTPKEIEDLISENVARALTDFEKILNDKKKT